MSTHVPFYCVIVDHGHVFNMRFGTSVFKP